MDGRFCLLALIFFFTFAFFNVSRWIWTVGIASLIVIGHRLGCLNAATYALSWILFVPLAVFFNTPSLRAHWLTRPLFTWFRTQLPPMSDTEREAILAGDSSFEAELFQGMPQWGRFLDKKPATLSPEESAFLENQVNTLCSMLNDWEINQRDHDLPKPVWDYLKKEGFFGLIVPKSYGGREFSSAANSAIITRIATRSGTAGVTTMVPNSLGPAELLIHYGTDAQRDYYLPRLAKGIEIPCFALTSPEAGSDAGAIPDFGIVCKQQWEGKETVGMRLTWNKRYITLAPVATVLGLAVKLYDPDHLLGSQEELGITVCLLPTNHPGVEIGDRHYPAHLAFMNGTTEGKDVFVPLDWIIGGQKMAGQGWRMLMACLAAGRGISLPALSTASAQMCYRTTGAYSKIRQQFKVSLTEFEGVQAHLAQIGGYTYLIEAMRRLTVQILDEGIKPSVITAIAKYHMTELARKTVNMAMDVHGGKAVILGPNNYLASAYSGLPVSITVEGANILTRCLIIFGQGAIRCHPHLKSMMDAAEQKDAAEALREFDKHFFHQIGYSISNFARAFLFGLTRGKIAKAPTRDWTAQYFKSITWLSASLAFVADVSLLVLGGKLKRKEMTSARLGDVLSYLYMASAVLKFYQDNDKDELSALHAKWALTFCLHKTAEAFNEYFRNFQPKWLGLMMKCVTQPIGMQFDSPKDEEGQRIAKSMGNVSAFRSRLTGLCYLPLDEEEPIGRLEAALILMPAAEELHHKVRKAVAEGKIIKYRSQLEKIEDAIALGVLSGSEGDLLKRYEHLRLGVINVDQFKPEFFQSAR